MENYLVRLVFEVSIEGRHDHFDAQLRLFRKRDDLSAIEACDAYVKEEEGSFVNRAGNVVTWRFAGISFFMALGEVSAGGLIESMSLREDHTSYRQYLEAVNAGIRAKTLLLV